MTTARDLRRCALQALYQFDAVQDASPEIVRESLEHSAGDTRTHDKGFRLATDAWAMREEADATVAELTPDWPTHRQPVVDSESCFGQFAQTAARVALAASLKQDVDGVGEREGLMGLLLQGLPDQRLGRNPVPRRETQSSALKQGHGGGRGQQRLGFIKLAGLQPLSHRRFLNDPADR